MAREFVEHECFDAAEALELLDVMAAEDLDLQIVGAIRHAKWVAMLACCGSSMQTTVARYALSRVIVLLEGQVVVAAS